VRLREELEEWLPGFVPEDPADGGEAVAEA
jgi:hypothetical protein